MFCCFLVGRTVSVWGCDLDWLAKSLRAAIQTGMAWGGSFASILLLMSHCRHSSSLESSQTGFVPVSESLVEQGNMRVLILPKESLKP